MQDLQEKMMKDEMSYSPLGGQPDSKYNVVSSPTTERKRSLIVSDDHSGTFAGRVHPI